MRVVVTPLRAPTGAAALAAAATLDYLSGGRQAALPASAQPADAVGYFADQTTEGPGRWLGEGARRFGLVGAVQRANLETLLRGDDPRSGAPLLGTRGSNLRAQATRGDSVPVSWDHAHYTFQDAALVLGVSDRYLRKVAGRTHALLQRTGAGDATTLAAIEANGRAFLIADQGDDGRWRVARDELLRFASARRTAAVTMGFDVTFSVPKSVSVLWSLADPAARVAITESFGCAVDAGIGYLERHAAVSGRGADRVRGRGLAAASFTHATSRRLDPQLHAHVVVANAVETSGGEHRALDGSALYEHARTAAYLAGAQLRHELTSRLGLGWNMVRTGVAEVEGVPRPVIEAMSQRRREIDELADQAGVTTPTGRRALALRSRTEKQVTSLDTLRHEWADRLADAGFDAAAHRACLGRRPGIDIPSRENRLELIARLTRHDGLTAHSPTFTRQDVVQAVSDWSLDRLDAPGVEHLADEFLADERVLALTPRPAGTRVLGSTGLEPGRGATGEQRFTTRAMVRAEARVLGAFRAGLRAGVGRVDPAVVARAVAAFPELGHDQSAAVARLCRSGQRIQCLVGAAGSGKTHTLRAAAAAWRAAGYSVIGVAVQGTAAENLETASGIPTRTLASVLTAVDRDGPHAVAPDPRTIIIVDEASAVGTFEFARLVDLTEAVQGTVVLVGDPAQHSAVTAGGAFRAVTRRWANQTVRLSGVRRQAAGEMANVRQAVDELRTRDTDVALHRFVVDGRISTAASRDEAYSELIAHWSSDRTIRRADGTARHTCMVTDDHQTRRALIDRARVHLQERGEVHGPTLIVAGQPFQTGDELIARAPARELHPDGAPDRFVRNGTCGRVVAVHEPDSAAAHLVVDFDGRGPMVVPAASLTRELRPGIVGVLTHSYALTSHAAQGATFDTVHSFATERTSAAALYVAASRGREDVRIYTASSPRGHDAERGDSLWPSASEVTGLQALARSMRGRGDECLAVERDPSLLTRFDADRRAAADPLEPESYIEVGRDDRLGRDIEPVAEAVRIEAEPVIEVV